MRHALIERSTGKVVNVIEAPKDWEVAQNLQVIATDVGNPGDTWDGAEFIRPPLPQRVPTPRELYEATGTTQEKLDVIAQRLGLKE